MPEQVLIVFKNNVPELISHISTGEQNPDGTPKKWCEILTLDTDANGEPLAEPVTKDECADAKTPGGVFRFTRRYEGKRAIVFDGSERLPLRAFIGPEINGHNSGLVLPAAQIL